MSRGFIPVGLLTLGLLPVSAAAQCDFDAPAKARGLKSDMVRAFVPCGTGITFPSPNTAGSSGTPGCTPPTTYSDYQFGPKGKCSVQASNKIESPCKNGFPPVCSNPTFKSRCSDITTADGVTAISGQGWALNTLHRVTLNDRATGDQTVVDFPNQFAFPPANRGNLKVKADINSFWNLLFGPPQPGFATCASIELISIKIVDPLGRPFATIGSSTR